MTNAFMKKVGLGFGVLALSGVSHAAEFGLFEFRTDGGFYNNAGNAADPLNATCDDTNCQLTFTEDPNQNNAPGGQRTTEMSWGVPLNDADEQSALRIINGRSFSNRDVDGVAPTDRYGSQSFNADPFAAYIELGQWTAIGYALHYNNIVDGASPAGTLETATVQQRIRFYGKNDVNSNSRFKVADTGWVSLPLTLDETTNKRNCDGPNPLGTNCDDVFVSARLPGAVVFDVDGNQFAATFRTIAFQNAFVVQDAPIPGLNTTYTAEDDPGLSVIQTQTRIRQIPAPGVLALLGMGLALLGFRGRRSA